MVPEGFFTSFFPDLVEALDDFEDFFFTKACNNNLREHKILVSSKKIFSTILFEET